jgi:hypothetical protein
MTNLDLVDWTMQEARQIGGQRGQVEIKTAPSLENLLEVLDSGRPVPIAPDQHLGDVNDQTNSLSPTLSPDGETFKEPQSTIATNLPIVTLTTSAIPAECPAPISPRLKAIMDPDIFTAPPDRDRGIFLRWVLRDIKASRLKLFPVDPEDLRDLVELGLVEMAEGEPRLTEAGISAIR